VVALAFQHPLIEGGPVVANGPGELDIGRTVATMTGDLQELLAHTQVLCGFRGRQIGRTTIREEIGLVGSPIIDRPGYGIVGEMAQVPVGR
jgi:hypothetical protein